MKKKAKMCGRSSLTVTEKQLEIRFGSSFYSEDLERYNPLPSFNIAPTHVLPCLTMEDPSYFSPMRWGLIPSWSKTPAIGSKLINARVETILEKSIFKQCVPHRRCLIPLDGYYEWMKQGKQRIPYRITRPEGGIFAVAGLFDQWKDPTGQIINSFTIITQPASPSIAHIHDRMPAILDRNEEKSWLDKSLNVHDLISLIRPAADDEIHFYRVGDQVNQVRNNDPSLILPVLEIDNHDTNQLSLFD
jgi:putative SOS response-associated peptidase YedK